MRISCPHCGFFKDIDPARIPPGTASANCPQCRQSFRVDGPERENPGPEEPPLSQPSHPSPSPDNLPKAGFWIRVVAALIDSVLVNILRFGLQFLLLQLALLFLGAQAPPPVVVQTIDVCGMLLVGTYFVFFTGYGGQTPGKMATKIKVIRTSGEEVSYGRAFLREIIGKSLSWLILGIGYLMVAFDRQKQGLHDKIAATYVIKI